MMSPTGVLALLQRLDLRAHTARFYHLCLRPSLTPSQSRVMVRLPAG